MTSGTNNTIDISEDVNRVVGQILDDFEYPEKNEKQIFLLFGGFQGSGKTTIIEKIRNDLNLAVVSPDEIRDVMFKSGYELDERFGQIVEEVTKKIAGYLVGQGYSLVIDNNMTPKRTGKVKKLLSNQNNEHKLVTVCLNASVDELEKRLKSREKIPGKYKGTVDELRASLNKYGENDPSKYDLVFDTQELSVDEIALRIIKAVA